MCECCCCNCDESTCAFEKLARNCNGFKGWKKSGEIIYLEIDLCKMFYLGPTIEEAKSCGYRVTEMNNYSKCTLEVKFQKC